MIKDDVLSPSSASDYEHRLEAHVRDLREASNELHMAWRAYTDLRYGGPRFADPNFRLPDDDERVVAASERIERARQRWYAAHRCIEGFVGRGLELRCGVSDWRNSEYYSRAHCTLNAGHEGKHSFELPCEQRGGYLGEGRDYCCDLHLDHGGPHSFEIDQEGA